MFCKTDEIWRPANIEVESGFFKTRAARSTGFPGLGDNQVGKPLIDGSLWAFHGYNCRLSDLYRVLPFTTTGRGSVKRGLQRIMARIVRPIVLLLLVASLGACGQKGPLRRPEAVTLSAVTEVPTAKFR